MSLKSIRESYSKLLTAFNDAGVKLNESQKSDIDSFVMAIESTMSKQRETAIRQTKQIVEAKLEKEYREVVESLVANINEHSDLAAKIQSKAIALEESQKLGGEVSKYIDECIAKVLPTKTVVDYDKMKRLEKIHESLKSALAMTEETVEAKKAELDESYKAKQSKCETEVAKLQAKLNESLHKNEELTKRLDAVEARELLESKTKDLPAFEARQVKKQLKEAATPAAVNEKFDDTLKQVQKTAQEAEKDQELEIEAEINKIITGDDVKEDDLLDNRPHNAHVAESEEQVKEDDMLKKTPHNGDAQHNAHNEESEDEVFETMEIIRMNESGDVELDESDVIDADLMKQWCNQSIEVR